MLRGLIVLVGCYSVTACADFSFEHRRDAALAEVAKEVASTCPAFAKASKAPLGSPADLAAIRDSLSKHESGDIAEIRWVSNSRVVVAFVKSLWVKPGPLEARPRFGNLATSTYCCELRRQPGGHWVLTRSQMLTIA
jgi:hypothetical protein